MKWPLGLPQAPAPSPLGFLALSSALGFKGGGEVEMEQLVTLWLMVILYGPMVLLLADCTKRSKSTLVATASVALLLQAVTGIVLFHNWSDGGWAEHPSANLIAVALFLVALSIAGTISILDSVLEEVRSRRLE